MPARATTTGPPTPPSSNPEGIQEGFQHLIQHNASTSFPHQQYHFDGSNGQMMSTGSSPFELTDDLYEGGGYQYGGRQSPFTYGQPQDIGLGISYGGQQFPMKTESPYGPIPDDSDLYGYGTPAGSPQTTISTPDIDVIRTRSGQVINRPVQHLKPSPKEPYRPSRSPRPKKVKKEKVKTENRVPRLEKPLSELTKNWTHVPVVDIEAYVNRPAEDRRREVEEGKNPGKVKRPMNSFMLYRKAYQNRTKNWCLQNNHQVVSQVCGDSWPLEPDSVREQFNEWSRVERQNHQNAHPGYKFSPSKAGTTKAVKRKASADSDESDLEDFDWQGNRARPVKQQRLTPKPDSPAPFRGSPYYGSDMGSMSRGSSVEPSMGGGYISSTYRASNPGRPAPQQYNQSDLPNGHYWQQEVIRSRQHPNVEDVVMRRAVAPSMNAASRQGYQPYYPDHADIGGYQFDSTPEIKIDPSLMGHSQPPYDNPYAADSGLYLDDGDSLNDGHQWQQPGGNIDQSLQEEYPDYLGAQTAVEILPASTPHVDISSTGDSWQVESLDAGDEFNKWMDGE